MPSQKRSSKKFTLQKPPLVQRAATGCNNQKNALSHDFAKYLAGQRLTERHHAAIDLLLHGSTDTQVAEALAVDRTTIFRWRTCVGRFRDELRRQRDVLREQSLGRLGAMIQPALDILQQQLAGNDPKAALRAASILLRAAGTGRVFQSNPEGRSERGADMNDDPLMRRVDAYINAPPPGPTSLPPGEADGVGDEMDDEDGDEDDDHA